MKRKVYHWLMPENTYRVPINLLLVKDHEAGIAWIEKHYRKRKEVDYSFIKKSAGGHFLWEGGNDETIVWITDEDDITCLAHELNHYTIAVLEHRGVPINEACSEAFTYLHQGVFIQALLCLGHRKIAGKSVQSAQEGEK